ncbi:MAG: pyridoxal phosphate-dependent aminotransferase [Anaerolineae bacterium]|nr:pyridoxal phosphate-dependent aminotransferase [Anaerolineae bacterium]
MPVADRMTRLRGEGAIEVLARASSMQAQGRDIVHLEIGEPDFGTPQHIVEAGIRALRAGNTHYCQAPGIPQLREAIAAHVSATRGITVAPEQVVVTPGSKPIAFFTILAMLAEGDEAIYTNPGFPVFETTIEFAGATPVPIPLLEERGFGLDLDGLEKAISPRTRLLILNSPHNPTGSAADAADLERIAALARNRGIYVLSDEVYSRLQYDGEFCSIASFPGMQERTIILDGFSKTYAMTGWRLGYGVMPRELAEHVTRLVINSNSCTPAFIQLAGVEALQGPQDEVERMVAAFRERRDAIVAGLNAIDGIRCTRPRGAFYVFPNVRELGMSSSDLADYLLEEAGVATLPGTAFGAYGEGFIRLTYANSIENIRKALERISLALRRL